MNLPADTPPSQDDRCKVSVCVDVFNYADFLPQAIESVLSQTLTDFELLVQDDCSTDASFEIAQGYAQKDSRVRVERNPVNLGMVKNRNACLGRAQGTYIKFVHADDFLFSPDALRRLVAVMDEYPATSLVTAAIQSVDATGNPTRVSRWFSGDRRLSGTGVIARCLHEQNNLIGGPSATLFRRSQATRGFDERYFHAADLEMWFHLLEQGCFAYIDEPLVAYRWHPGQQTEKDRANLSQANDTRALLDTYLSKPYIRVRSALREYLLHENVRQTLRRARKIGQRDEGTRVLEAYGTRRYWKNYGWCWAWTKARKTARLVAKRVPAAQAKLLPRPALPKGINIAGFFQGEYGIGESSRAFCRAAEETGLPCTRVNIESRNHRNQDRTLTGFDSRNPYGVNLMTFSFDYARRFRRDQGERFFQGRANVALWYWELEKFPARWHSNFDYYDEIWVPTEFCRASLAAVSPIPIRKISYPLYGVENVQAHRTRFALPKDAFVFLFNWDFFSTLARKNPLGVIAAFRQAFHGTTDAVLVLKSINSAHDAKGRAIIEQAMQGLNIVWIEEHLTGAEINALFASADCYVSLHRSEGLGLGMAQAMRLGKPVIATGYSGNLEYMNPENSLLIDYERVELAEDYGPDSQPAIYEKGNIWAEPSLEQAAEKMRWVLAHPDAASEIGARGCRDIRQFLNPETTQKEIAARIEELCRR